MPPASSNETVPAAPDPVAKPMLPRMAVALSRVRSMPVTAWPWATVTVVVAGR